MAEVAATPWNGLVVASLFAGCGGSSLGYRMAGYRVAYALDSDPAARASYAPNKASSTILDDRDVRTVKGAEVLDACGGALDVLDGSPPCVSFSTAGRRASGWGKKRAHAGLVQTQDDLFGEYLRLVGEIRPRAFVAENVSGMIKGVAKGYFIEVLEEARRLGYRTRCKLLDAQWLGVPQARQRVIFVGLREDLFPDVEPPFPRPMPHRYSLRDACPWIVREITSHGVRDADSAAASTIMSGKVSPTAKFGGLGIVEAETDISRYAIGKDARSIREGGKSKKYLNLRRASRDRPSPTITAEGGVSSLAAVVHPVEQRKFTIAELKRVCAFPDDFELVGSYEQQWARLGNSVPPLMMRAVAVALIPVLLGGGGGRP